MYNAIKGLAKAILPQGFLVNNERLIRNLLVPFYFGSKHQCNICSVRLKKFAVLQNGDLLCPRCGSLSRNRRLWSILKEDLLPGAEILHFSPSRSLYRKLKAYKNIQYTSSDYEGEFIADERFDITNIQAPDNSFSRIICFHVLEHIPDDRKAMQELFRILKPGGKAYLQTPFKPGEVYEDPSITNPEEREKHFGQKDHVRIYSAEGLMKRLAEAGFKVEVLQFNEEPGNFHGFALEESILLAEKSRTPFV
jgi:SAM-dependent methyltransferase